MRTMRTRMLTAAATLVFAALLPVTAPVAATCSDKPVTARGDPSRFETLAKVKARGNWRAKVRVLPGLGAEYANWNRAIGSDYRCTQRAGGYLCDATAYPCRND